MHDIRHIRDDPDAFDAGLARRGHPPAAAEVLALDRARREIQTRRDELLARRRQLSREIGRRRATGENDGEPAPPPAAIRQEIQELETREGELAARLDEVLSHLPNLPDTPVPDGSDESGNVEIHRRGTPPVFSFPPREHARTGAALGMDFASAAGIAGARFVTLWGALATLERVLAGFMLDIHRREFGYTEVSPPLLVHGRVLYGAGQLPKFAGDLFSVAGSDLWLAPTAEPALVGLVRGRILPESSLPLRVVAMTPCFRREAGSAGRDTRGIIRQHQFYKTELVSITRPDASDAELERMTSAAETVLERLELPFRRVLLCAGDMGFSARRTYDLEVWMPSGGCYREISSCSDCGVFQARRLRVRFRPGDGARNLFPHTLNGSGVAIGRTLAAILENGQQEDGSVRLPAALRPWLAQAGLPDILRGDGSAYPPGQ